MKKSEQKIDHNIFLLLVIITILFNNKAHKLCSY